MSVYDLAAWLIAAAVIMAIARFSRKPGLRGADTSAEIPGKLPAAVAAERIRKRLKGIDDELAQLEAEQAALPEEEVLRQKWVRKCVELELSRAPIEAVQVKGLSDSVYRALRDSEFTTVGSLSEIRKWAVDGIGEDREGKLVLEYKRWREAAERQAEALSDQELDVRVKGRFSDEVVARQSHGAELARKIAALRASRVVLVDRAAKAGLVLRPTAKKAVPERPTPTQGTAKCPRCGGSLVRRRGRTGTFLGCASFPRCRYTSA